MKNYWLNFFRYQNVSKNYSKSSVIYFLLDETSKNKFLRLSKYCRNYDLLI